MNFTFENERAIMSHILKEPADVYHGPEHRNCMSSHRLADFRKCPLLYRKKMLGEIPDVDRPSYAIGRAAHKYIIEGLDAFSAEYAVGGPINPKTNAPYGRETKAWAEYAAMVGRPIISETDMEMIRNMADSVHVHRHAPGLLRDGVAEGVVRTAGPVVACQIRMDYFSVLHGIVDLKTCDDLDHLEQDIWRYGYLYQMAFYRSIMFAVTGWRGPVHIIGVEKKPPYRCGVWRMAEEMLNIITDENDAALERYAECLADDEWPTGFEDIRTFGSPNDTPPAEAINPEEM